MYVDIILISPPPFLVDFLAEGQKLIYVRIVKYPDISIIPPLFLSGKIAQGGVGWGISMISTYMNFEY